MKNQNVEKLPLSEAVTHLLEECRMVLPGIQALFGFQLIVVFNPTFQEKLNSPERLLHLSAIVLVVVSIAMIMAPAAYHRQRNPEAVTEGFIAIATRMLLYSMFPLMFAIGFECFLVTLMITSRVSVSLALAALLVCVCFMLWFVLPRSRRLEGLLGSRRR
jgi:cytochrome bd-type quinol oxidase subunit 2